MKLNPELWLVFLPAFSAMLFALGGTRLTDKVQGQKWIRRFVLPTLLGLSVFFGGFHWWQALMVGLFSCASFHLGYGERTSWKMKWLVFASYGLIALPIGFSAWNVIAGLLPTPIMWLSNTKVTRNMFVWKVCEASFGFLVGISVGFILAGYGVPFFK